MFLPVRKTAAECKEFLHSFPENSTTLRWLERSLSDFVEVDVDRGSWESKVSRVRQIYGTTMRVRTKTKNMNF